jgi:type VI secretion system secreted protein VgrG
VDVRLADAFRFELAGAPPGLRVVAFSGAEALSEPFQYEVRVGVPRGTWDEWDDAWFEEHLGKPATLTITWFDSVRYVHGIVTSFELLEVGDKSASYVVGLGSPLAVLGLNRRMHVHQNQTTRAIVDAVLARCGLTEVRWTLGAAYTPRNYCVQYRETDLDFVSRLLEEEGITYFFDHDASGVTLVITDEPSSFKPIAGDPVLPLQMGEGMTREVESVRFMGFEQRMRPKKIVLGDYTFKKPALDVQSSSTSPSAAEGLVYDHPGEFVDTAIGDRLARVRVEELDATRVVGGAGSDSPRMLPGRKFRLDDRQCHSRSREFVVVRVQHEGTQPLGHGSEPPHYLNTLTVIPATTRGKPTPYRPARLTPRPIVVGTHTATVVGPAGEEIHVDEYGRVKVRFHWDRGSETPESASCWVRVAQVWAGAGFGGIDIPRVGQEVLVSFIEGDPDRPIVVGRVYNGLNLVPYPLPDHKTRTTIKSSSTPGGGGFNELMFEDAKGQELVYLQAEHDLESVVKVDETGNVGESRTTRVGKIDRTDVGDTFVVTVGQDNGIRIEKTHKVVVTTNGASIELAQDHIVLNAKGNIHIHAGGELLLTSKGDMHIDSGTDTFINCASAPAAEVDPFGEAEPPRLQRSRP